MLLSADELSLDELSLEAVSLDELSLEELSLDEASLEELSLDETSLDELSLDELPEFEPPSEQAVNVRHMAASNPDKIFLSFIVFFLSSAHKKCAPKDATENRRNYRRITRNKQVPKISEPYPIYFICDLSA